ncbi:hypothetical protein K439DRAFT_1613725 [Ramaria rubella]|nr:hypothetical protein K439DRAFT_1613725 [Ramaria rubella]
MQLAIPTYQLQAPTRCPVLYCFVVADVRCYKSEQNSSSKHPLKKRLHALFCVKGQRKLDAREYEDGAGSENIVDEVLNEEEIVLAGCSLNDGVVVMRDVWLVHFAISSFVRLANTLSMRLVVGAKSCQRWANALRIGSEMILTGTLNFNFVLVKEKGVIEVTLTCMGKWSPALNSYSNIHTQTSLLLHHADNILAIIFQLWK